MTSFVQIVVNVPAVSGVFDYAVPKSLEGMVGMGHLVIVPFGRQTVQGVVYRFVDQPSVADVKEIREVVDEEPVLTQVQLALAKELADSTLQPLAAIVGLFLPVGLKQQADILYSICETDVINQKSKTDPNIFNSRTKKLTTEDRLLNLLRLHGPLRGRQIDTHFAKVNWRKAANFLVRKGSLASKNILPPPRVRKKYIRVTQLAVPPEAAEAAMDILGTRQTLARRQAALRFLIQQPEAINISWVYAESGCNLNDLQELEERGLIRLFESEIFRDPLEKKSRQMGTYTDAQAVELTHEQDLALGKITDGLRGTKSETFLLQGVTGSGKTEIYIRAVQDVVRRGRQAIILVPEIALTPQTVRRFLGRFPGQVGLVHSRLSEGERYDTWRRARTGQLKVIIGARSALFSPLPNIGLIVVDECHDSSYHQAEPPFYHAVNVAQLYAHLSGAACVLGSATPTVIQRYKADTKQIQKLELLKRIVEKGLPPVHIVDMRDELKAGHRGIFSRLLIHEIESTLKRGEQAILFLNRRGTATYVFCRDCGYVLKCPNCDSPLTFHTGNKDRLLCHTCGYEREKPKSCPQCGGRHIREYGLGSEKVEAEVNALFPKAKTLRWDWDTTRKKDAHELILTHFANTMPTSVTKGKSSPLASIWVPINTSAL